MSSTYVLYAFSQIFNILFYLFIYINFTLFYLFIYINSQLKKKKKKFLLIIYSLNLSLCLHLAINSLLLFNNFLALEKVKCGFFPQDTDCTYYRKTLGY